MNDFLKSTYFLDFEHSSIQEYISDIQTIPSKKKQAIALYLKVRDGFLYDPFHLDLRYETLQSSTILTKKRAWCVEKAIVLASGLRALNIPASLGYAIVQNHIGVEKLTDMLKTEKIVFHGYVAVYLDEKWIKITPAFDKRVCRISQVQPLDWDGENDALLQAFEGHKKFMEYHHDYGTFNDVPIELMNQEMKKYYPHLFNGTHENSKLFSFYHL
jgi:transglutaminase-like putative cysteine protease